VRVTNAKRTKNTRQHTQHHHTRRGSGARTKRFGINLAPSTRRPRLAPLMPVMVGNAAAGACATRPETAARRTPTVGIATDIAVMENIVKGLGGSAVREWPGGSGGARRCFSRRDASSSFPFEFRRISSNRHRKLVFIQIDSPTCPLSPSYPDRPTRALRETCVEFTATSLVSLWRRPPMFAHARVPAATPVTSWRRSPRHPRRSRPSPVTRASIADPTSIPPTVTTKAGTKQTAIVVGGGVGGLGIASRLAHAGYDVTILEKNLDTGGRCRSEAFAGAAAGYRFDTGPSLMLLPDRYREQFTAVGKKMSDYMTIDRVDPAYRAHFGDHTSLDLLYDTGKGFPKYTFPLYTFPCTTFRRLTTDFPYNTSTDTFFHSS
jgi:hypothetical protein